MPMPAVTSAAGLAVGAITVVTSGLLREFLVARALRRELDRYLDWLLENASGPVGAALRA